VRCATPDQTTGLRGRLMVALFQPDSGAQAGGRFQLARLGATKIALQAVSSSRQDSCRRPAAQAAVATAPETALKLDPDIPNPLFSRWLLNPLHLNHVQ